MSTTYSDLTFTTFPDSVQSFITMLNMAAEDAAAVTAYQKAMQEGDTVSAQTAFTRITNGNQKIIDATKMNTLMDTCVALQRFYSTDIQPYIATKQTEWSNRVNQFTYLGTYNSTTKYNAYNFVDYTTVGVKYVFICLSNDTPIGTDPTNTTYWRKLTIRGEQGVTGGSGLAFRFAWDSGTSYTVDNVVTYNNGVWGCIQNNINQPPVEGSQYWELIYNAHQNVYPVQSTQPSGLSTGYLWFQTT